MCGIVGLYLKNSELESSLGALFAPMLIAMTDRGPDSAGFAIYRDEEDEDQIKVTCMHADTTLDWNGILQEMRSLFSSEVSLLQNANAAVFKLAEKEEDVRTFFSENHPDVSIMSVGRSIEILKDTGLPAEISARFKLAGMAGSHIIGHTRMATESAVTTEGSHPFSTGMDLCLVHNGSLSNHNGLREKLKRQGIQIKTDNDSEVAAGYLEWRLREGDSLDGALEHALKDLDGFFTFAIGTRDGFAVLRDPIACKPAVLAETEDYVAMASEYRSLAGLPGIENARLWEPEPGKIYTWGKNAS
jgi:glutamate synthase domain-containing protein 1